MSNELCHSFRIHCKSRSVCVIGQWHMTIEVSKICENNLCTDSRENNFGNRYNESSICAIVSEFVAIVGQCL